MLNHNEFNTQVQKSLRFGDHAIFWCDGTDKSEGVREEVIDREDTHFHIKKDLL